MNILFTSPILILVFIDYSLAKSNNFSPLRGKLILCVNGCTTVPQTDFKDIKPSSFGMGNIEYYFRTKSMHISGIHLNEVGGILKGIEERYTPTEFTHSLFFLGGGLVYSYLIDTKVLPYIFIGASMLGLIHRIITGILLFPEYLPLRAYLKSTITES